jgi:DNA mismatch repair protein MSH4
LARIVALPPAVLDVATKVSAKLAKQIDRRKKSSSAFALARRRKLILNLKETLVQARDGPMEGEALASWLRKLQEEFVVRMSAIDAETADVGTENSEDMNETDGSGDDAESREKYGLGSVEGEAEDESEPTTDADDQT